MDKCNSVNQRIVGQLVEREVKHCLSYLITHLREVDPDDERLLDLCERRDYETPLEEVTDEQWLSLATNNDLDFTTKEAVISKLGAVECCDQLGLDPQYNEVYEHWLVSSWALEKLKEQGEVVCEDLHGLDVWGRCCTGQSICLDSVWWRIASGMRILQDQAYSWENKK
jgi:hypothetical protein